MHGGPQPHEYAAAGAGALERRAVCRGGAALATAVSREHTEVVEQIGAAFLRLTGRRPDAVELELLTEVYNEQRKLFADMTQQDAFRFIQLGEAQPDPTMVPANVAALAVTCQAILNLDATIFER